MRRVRTRRGMPVVTTVCLILVAGCADHRSSLVDKSTIVVGVKYDQPGMGMKTGAQVEGFDVDVARYVATKLGADHVRFLEARSANRETFLANGTVDMVVASYSITPARKQKVTFAGPYIVTHQDILVRSGETSITGLDTLKHKRLCQVAGSSAWKNIVDGVNKPKLRVPVSLVPAQGYDECIVKLKGGAVDAVSTDAVVIAGYARREGTALRVVNAPFTDEKYGIGIRKGDIAGCEAVNKAIAAFYQDGTAQRVWKKWFDPAQLPFDASPPPPEGCE